MVPVSVLSAVLVSLFSGLQAESLAKPGRPWKVTLTGPSILHTGSSSTRNICLPPYSKNLQSEGLVQLTPFSFPCHTHMHANGPSKLQEALNRTTCLKKKTYYNMILSCTLYIYVPGRTWPISQAITLSICMSVCSVGTLHSVSITITMTPVK